MAYQRGSGFVGLQQYLNANQQQGAALGNSVASRLEGNIANTSSGVMSELNDAVAGVQAAANAVPGYVEPTSREDADAKARAARYTGPQGLSAEKVAAARAGISDVEQQGKYGQTDAGVATLLQQQYGNGYTGVGGRSLDAALARRGAGERLDNAGKQGVAKLQQYLGTANQQAIEAGQQGLVNAATTRQQYENWQPQQTLGTPQRNPIQTPGTMPDKPGRKRTAVDNVARWLFRGGG